MQREFYHNLTQFTETELSQLVEHARDYLAGERTIPVLRTNDDKGGRLTFTLADRLLQGLVENPQQLKKPIEVALKYGFRGFSKGEKNGIFYLRKEDNGLLKGARKLLNQSSTQVIHDLDVSEEKFDALERVKIVWHQPNGNRVVGAYNEQNSRILFLGFANYNGLKPQR